MGWSHLPVELQTVVFQYFLGDQKNLKQISSVCKGWLSTAQITLHTDVNLTERNFVSFVHCISNGSTIRGETTTAIQLRDFSEAGSSIIEPNLVTTLVKIVEYCPNVQLLDIQYNMLEDLYETLQMTSGGWKKLKEIKTYPTEYLDDFVDQKQLLRMFSNSLKTIEFHLKNPPNHIMDDVEYYLLQLGDLVDYLQQFSKVKKLKLRVGDANADFQEYDGILDELPSTVKDLTFNSTWRTNVQFGSEDSDSVFRTITETVKRIHTLVTLKTNLPIMNARNIYYILHKFPRLESLKLANTANTFMGVSSVRYYLPKTILQQIIDRALLMKEMDIDRLHLSNENELLDMLIVEKKLVKELVLGRKSNVMTQHAACCLIDIKKRTQYGKSVMNIISTYLYNQSLAYNIQDQFELIQNYGDKIFTLTMDHSEDRYPDFRPEDCPYILNSIFSYCPLLETLIFKGVNLGYYRLPDVSTVSQNDSIKTLFMINSTRATKTTFHFLSQRLPSIEELNYEIPINNCNNEKEFDGYIPRKNQVNMDMPYNQFERIKIHFYNLKICSNRLCFIKLTTSDSIRHFVCFERCNRNIKNPMSECTEAAFQELLSMKRFQRVPCFIIKCKSLKQLHFTSKKSDYGDFSDRICTF